LLQTLCFGIIILQQQHLCFLKAGSRNSLLFQSI